MQYGQQSLISTVSGAKSAYYYKVATSGARGQAIVVTRASVWVPVSTGP